MENYQHNSDNDCLIYRIILYRSLCPIRNTPSLLWWKYKMIPSLFHSYLHKFGYVHLKHDLFKPVMSIHVIFNYIIKHYRISPNKCAGLNKHTPDFWLWLAISQKLFNWSESYFQHVKCRYLCVHCNFHWDQARLRIRCLPPRPARLFGKIRYLK